MRDYQADIAGVIIKIADLTTYQVVRHLQELARGEIEIYDDNFTLDDLRERLQLELFIRENNLR